MSSENQANKHDDGGRAGPPQSVQDSRGTLNGAREVTIHDGSFTNNNQVDQRTKTRNMTKNSHNRTRIGHTVTGNKVLRIEQHNYLNVTPGDVSRMRVGNLAHLAGAVLPDFNFDQSTCILNEERAVAPMLLGYSSRAAGGYIEAAPVAPAAIDIPEHNGGRAVSTSEGNRALFALRGSELEESSRRLVNHSQLKAGGNSAGHLDAGGSQSRPPKAISALSPTASRGDSIGQWTDFVEGQSSLSPRMNASSPLAATFGGPSQERSRLAQVLAPLSPDTHEITRQLVSPVPARQPSHEIEYHGMELYHAQKAPASPSSTESSVDLSMSFHSHSSAESELRHQDINSSVRQKMLFSAQSTPLPALPSGSSTSKPNITAVSGQLQIQDIGEQRKAVVQSQPIHEGTEGTGGKGKGKGKSPSNIPPQPQANKINNDEVGIAGKPYHTDEAATTGTADEFIDPQGRPVLLPYRRSVDDPMFDHGDSSIPLMLTSSLINHQSIPFWYPKTYLDKAPFGTAQTHDFINGVAIGNVGYIESNGHFVSFVNVFDDLAKTPGFDQLYYKELAEASTPQSTAVGRGVSFTSSGITVANSKTDPPNFAISVTGKNLSKAGVIILPAGGRTYILSLKFFRNPIVIQYFKQKAKLWYESAATVEKVHELRNGSLVFVWGVHLSANPGMAILRLPTGKTAKTGLHGSFRPVSGGHAEYRWDLCSTEGKQMKGWVTSTSTSPASTCDVCYGVVASCIFLDADTLAKTAGGKIPQLPVVDADKPVTGSFISSLRVPRPGIIASLLGSSVSRVKATRLPQIAQDHHHDQGTQSIAYQLLPIVKSLDSYSHFNWKQNQRGRDHKLNLEVEDVPKSDK